MRIAVGVQVNYWMILEKIPGKLQNRYHWKARCDCGAEKILPTFEFRRVKSCGCKQAARGSKSNFYHHGDDLLSYMRQYQSNARKRKLIFDLSFSEFKRIVSLNCFYCNQPPEQRGRKKSNHLFYANGIDRKDSSIGYSESNSVPCCKKCNKCKSDLTSDDFILLAKTISQHHS